MSKVYFNVEKFPIGYSVVLAEIDDDGSLLSRENIGVQYYKKRITAEKERTSFQNEYIEELTNKFWKEVSEQQNEAPFGADDECGQKLLNEYIDSYLIR